jgi:hypothetical protein
LVYSLIDERKQEARQRNKSRSIGSYVDRVIFKSDDNLVVGIPNHVKAIVVIRNVDL